MVYVYAYAIVITNDYQEGFKDLKQHSFRHFQIMDISWLCYFLRIGVA